MMGLPKEMGGASNQMPGGYLHCQRCYIEVSTPGLCSSCRRHVAVVRVVNPDNSIKPDKDAK